MNTAPPHVNDLNSRLNWLQARLQEVRDPNERMPLLDELSFHLRCVDPVRAEAYAREEFRIATSIGDRYRIMKSLVCLGDSAIGRSRYALARRHFDRALHLLQELPDNPTEKAYIQRHIGNILFEMGRPQAALEMYESALKAVEQVADQQWTVPTLSAMSRIYIDLGQYTKGLILRKKALEISEANSFDLGKGVSFLEIGKIYFLIEDWDMALENYRRGLAIVRNVGDSLGEAQGCLDISSVYAMQGRFDEALKFSDAALELARKIDSPVLFGQAYSTIGEVWIVQGNCEKGLGYLEEAERRFDAIGAGLGKGVVLLQKGEALITLKEWEKAVAVLLEASTILGGAQLRAYLIHLEQLLGKAYEQNGDLEKSLSHYKRFIDLERALSCDEVRYELVFYRFQDHIRNMESEKRNYRTKAEQLEQEVHMHAREVTLLSLRVDQNNELLRQLRERLIDLKHSGRDASSIVNGILREIDNRSERIDARSTFERQLRTLDRDFVNRLMEACPSLTPAEIRICSLLRINMSNKEIGALLSLSDRTVDTHRTSIRKKMSLGREDNLVAVLAQV